MTSNPNSPIPNKKGRKRVSDETRLSSETSNDVTASSMNCEEINEQIKCLAEDKNVNKVIISLTENEKKRMQHKELWGDDHCICCQQKFCDVSYMS